MGVHRNIGNKEGDAMEIGPIRNNKTITGETQRQKGNERQVVEAESRTDTVEISLEARRRLAALADEQLTRLSKNENTAGEKPTPSARLARVRDRIDSGFYERPEIAEKIAEKLADELWKELNETDNYSEEP